MGEPRRAVDDFDRALQIEPDDLSTTGRRGQAYLALEEWGSAIRDFTAVIDWQPRYYEAFEGRAIAYDRTNRPDLAEKDRQAATRVKSNSEPGAAGKP
jgi:lipoprotein NlpI